MSPTRSILLLSLILAGATACVEDVAGPVSGGVRVLAVTTGGDLDLDGYLVVVDGNPPLSIPPQGELVLADLAPGLHVLELKGVADNCAVSPRDIRSITVTAADTTSVTFDVHCLATGVRVFVETTGLDLDLQYSLLVDGAAVSDVVALSHTEVTRIAPGVHTFQLGQVADNCQAPGPASRTVTLARGEIVPLAFEIVCSAATGAMRVAVATSGEDRDPSGYTVKVGESLRRPLKLDDSDVFALLPGGDYLVELTDVAPNCQVVGPNPRAVRVAVGGTARDTVETRFEVSCVLFYRIAFQSEGRLFLAPEDGSRPELFRNGGSPAWSPDGKRLAFDCGAICLIRTDGNLFVQLPTYKSAEGASWRADGARLAYGWYDCDDYYYYYGCSFGLATIGADGSSPEFVQLPAELTWASNPSWSPDGASIAFVCTTASDAGEICVVGPDGSGFRRLTSGAGANSRPAWRPDGSKIAFTSARFGRPEILIMNPDGTGVTRLLPDFSASSPAWSPDGQRLLFAALQGLIGLAVVNADGTGMRLLTSGLHATPAWRP